MHPYRARVPSPPESRATALQAIARGAVLLTEIPLAALVVAFFLPITREISAIGLLGRLADPVALLVVWPMHLAAAVLLVLVERARRGHRARPRVGPLSPRLPVPSPRARRAAYGLVVLSAIGSGTLVVYYLARSYERDFPLYAHGLAFAGLVVAFGSLVLARGARGWQRWAFVILGYAGSFTGVGMLYLCILMERSLACGGEVVLVAMGALYALGIVSVSTRVLLWRHTLRRRCSTEPFSPRPSITM